MCFLEEEKVLKLCVSCGNDLAGLSAGVGELLAGRGWDGKSGKVNDRVVVRRDTEP